MMAETFMKVSTEEWIDIYKKFRRSYTRSPILLYFGKEKLMIKNLSDILEKHHKWILNEEGGQRIDLREADLRIANLSGADLNGTKIEPMILNKFYPICCPEVGSFVAWKKVRGNLIVKLEVTENAKRSSAFGRKCRCNEAKVLDIQNLDGTSAEGITEAYSQHDTSFAYRVGETVRVDNFDEDRRNECAPSIHFFITRQEAVYY